MRGSEKSYRNSTARLAVRANSKTGWMLMRCCHIHDNAHGIPGQTTLASEGIAKWQRTETPHRVHVNPFHSTGSEIMKVCFSILYRDSITFVSAYLLEI